MRRKTANIAILSTALIAASGCSHMQRPEQTEQAEKADADTFLHDQLEKEPVVTACEAYRAMIMLADGEDKFSTCDERENALLCRGIVRSAWELQHDDSVDRGTVAYMVMRILKIRGGVNCMVFGRAGLGDRRYALHEMIDKELMYPSPPYRFITGGELVDLMGKADDYMSKHGAYDQPKLDIEEQVEHQKQNAKTRPAE